jgi:predicted AAA+ superfamily ATPase
MFKRNLTQDFLEALQDTPVLLVNGSRQTGKSTFVKTLLSNTHRYYTLDDPTTLQAIKKDPLMFLEGLPGPSIIDEVQRVPELFLPLKKIVDSDRRPGYFVLTGSANVLSLPRLADSLAGRMEIHTLWPLSQGEIQGKKEDFIHLLFNQDFSSGHSQLSLNQVIDMITQGGYPEVIQRPSPKRRKKWFSAYLTTLIEKDIKDLASIEGLFDLPNLMKIFAARGGSLLNISELSRSTGIPQTTLKRYLILLEKTFLLILLPTWTKNLAKRAVKMPKVYLNDTGLLSHLADCNPERFLDNKGFLGHVLENFVIMEFKKQMTWSEQSCEIYHYRTHTQQEIDIILEAPDSRIVAIDVKLANTVTLKDFSGIQSLEKDLGEKFHRGIILYMGDTVVPFSRNKYAVPLSYLWAAS